MEIFDVARVLGSLFGVGDGRVVLRAAADFIGERRSRVPDQGGTRKIVALGNTVDHLLTHHRNFHAAMHARLGLVGAGRSAQTQTKLIEVQALLSRKAPVFKEGWAAFQPVFKEGWTAFRQLAFRPLCKQDDITDAAKCGAKVCAERTHFFGLVVHESTVLLLARLSRHAWTNFMRRSRHWRRASQIQLHFRAIFDEHLEQNVSRVARDARLDPSLHGF